MNRKTLFAPFAILVMAGTYAVWSCDFAEDRAPSAGEVLPDEFAGKIVDIQTTTKRSYVLENVRLSQLGGQWFLSGTGVKDYCGLWWEGVPVRVNISSVVSYCPMTPQQFDEARDKLDEKQEK